MNIFHRISCTFFIAVSLLSVVHGPAQDRQQLKQELIQAAEPFERLSRLFQLSVEFADPSIVHIEATQLRSVNPGKAAGRNVEMQVEETGCGVVAEFDGKQVILTNRHVVEGIESEALQIRTSDRRMVRALQIRTNADFDLAVIEFDVSGEKLIPAELGDSDKVQVGDLILVVGSPFGLERSISLGLIGATNRRKIPSAPAHTSLSGFFQIDAAVNPGSSGGPMLNLQGEVVGIVTAIATQSGTNEGIAFVTPINAVKRIARQLARSEVALRPYIGVGFDPAFGPNEHRQFGLNRMIGAKIIRVLDDSPAALAGLEPNDIILKMNEIEIEDDSHLINLVAQSEIDKPFTLTVLREKKMMQFTITPSSQISR